MNKLLKGMVVASIVSGIGLGHGVSDAKIQEHTVKKGETVSSIAKQHHVKVLDIVKLNKLENKNKIKVGQVLKYDDKKVNRIVYTVKEGDTLYKIGKKYNVSYKSIMAKNGLESTLILPGDKLVVKGKPFEHVTKIKPVADTMNVPVVENQVQNYQAPVQTQQELPTTESPVQAQKQVTTYKAPVQAQKQVTSYKAPVQAQKQVSTYKAPVKSTTNSVAPATNSAVDAHLKVIMQRESGGNPRAVNPSGYYGLFQFSPQTWAAVGGTGNPANASVEEQWKRARILYTQYGAQHWSTAY